MSNPKLHLAEYELTACGRAIEDHTQLASTKTDVTCHYCLKRMVRSNELVHLRCAVKTFAVANYEQGWDVVVECYSNPELDELIGNAKTAKGAIWNVSRAIGPGNEYRQEIERTAF
jgi:hypothetical protein